MLLMRAAQGLRPEQTADMIGPWQAPWQIFHAPSLAIGTLASHAEKSNPNSKKLGDLPPLSL
jgi:hypothetical protein